MIKLGSARRLAQRVRGGRRDQKGAVAPIFAVIAGFLVMVTGVGMDISRVVGARTQLQDATDAAGLALGRMPATSDLNTVLLPAAKKWIIANLHGNAVNPSDITVTVTQQDNGVVVAATTMVQPTLAAMIHVGPFPVSSTSTIKYDITKVEVALVLDNTFSMSVPLDGGQAKIDVLKQAANSLVDTLMTPGNAGGVKIGVVPYGEYVNVGVGNRYASWITGVSDDSQTTSEMTPAKDAVAATPDTNVPESCAWNTPSKTTCTGGVWGTCYNYKDGAPTGSYGCWTTPQVCTTTYGAPVYQCTAAHVVKGQPAKPAVPAVMGTKYTKWFGCVKHQVSSGTLANPDPPASYKGFMETSGWNQPGFNSTYCMSEILPLNTDKATIKTAISAMVVSRGPQPNYYPETYVPGGLHWGVNVLSPPAPFQQGEAYDFKKNTYPRKALILMTDGTNTRKLNSDGTVTGPTGTAAQMAAQMATTYADEKRMCDYAKDAKIRNIEVYTVGFGVDDPTALTYLKSCATDSTHYFDAKSSADLLNAFQVIAGSLTKLRVAH